MFRVVQNLAATLARTKLILVFDVWIDTSAETQPLSPSRVALECQKSYKASQSRDASVEIKDAKLHSGRW